MRSVSDLSCNVEEIEMLFRFFPNKNLNVEMGKVQLLMRLKTNSQTPKSSTSPPTPVSLMKTNPD
ncbi:MAG: hypothetical protein R2769_15095 [Saprospiraceae bacterium]